MQIFKWVPAPTQDKNEPQSQPQEQQEIHSEPLPKEAKLEQQNNDASVLKQQPSNEMVLPAAWVI